MNTVHRDLWHDVGDVFTEIVMRGESVELIDSAMAASAAAYRIAWEVRDG